MEKVEIQDIETLSVLTDIADSMLKDAEEFPEDLEVRTHYPRATRCGGDIVTLLWFRPSVSPSVRQCVRHALPCEHDRNLTVVCLFIKLGRHVYYDERMNPIDFGDQRSKVKVTIGIYEIKLVNKIETKPLCASPSDLAYQLTIVRGRTLLILEVRGQRSRSPYTYMEISL